MTATSYSADQLRELEQGRQERLNVSLYENPHYLAAQMHEIRIGLEEGLPVECYADPKFNWFQMQEIREGLEHHIDINKYAKPQIPYGTMREIREGLQEGIDLSGKLKLPAEVLRELRHAKASGVDLSHYVAEGYDGDQLKEIRLALENGLTNIEDYISPGMRDVSIGQIRLGLEEKVDVTLYAGDELNWQQMREIRLGLDKHLDVTIYLKSLYSYRQMREIRLGLEAGLPVEKYSSFMYTATQMKEKRLALLSEKQCISSEGSTGTKYKNFELYVDAEQMRATIFLHDKRQKVERDELLAAFQQNNIKRGIDFEIMDHICDGLCTEDVSVIAKGKQPEQGKAGYYEFFFDTAPDKNPALLEDGSVDYHSIKCYESVKKGQKVAFYHRAEEGSPGYRLNGEVLPPIKGKELAILTGQNFKILQDQQTYVAAIDGKISLNGNQLMITNVLVVDEVTIANGGNISFNGTLHVLGDVGSGAQIYVSGDVLVNGFTEGAQIEAGGNVVLCKGNNAAGRGFVKAGGDVRGVFFEKANVTAGKNIQANYCLSSFLKAGENIEISGKNGVLVGGSASAGHQVKVYHLGNDMGLVTKVTVGEQNSLTMEELKITSHERRAEKELLLLQNAMTDMLQKYPEEARKVNPLCLKLEDAVFTKKAELKQIEDQKKDLNKRKKKKKECCVAAGGMIYPGVQVEVNGAIWQSEKLQSAVLREEKGYIKIESNSLRR